jgi:hypothetical protein
LCETYSRPVRERRQSDLDHQDRLARFLENHDEPRAAATFAPELHAAAAMLSCCTSGMRFSHQGRLEGRRVRISPHQLRGPAVYERCGDDRLGRGLYLDLPLWGHHPFEVQAPA